MLAADEPHDRADVVVVGGGVIGSAVALALAQSGKTVTVLDPETHAGSSSGNAGLVVPSYCLPPPTGAELRAAMLLLGRRGSGVALRAPFRPSTVVFLGRLLLGTRGRNSTTSACRLHDLAWRSLELYQSLAEEGLVQVEGRGWLWPCREAAAWDALLQRAQRLERLGVRLERLSGEEVRQREPALGTTPRGGLFFPDDLATDPQQLRRALVGAARERGVRFVPLPAVGLLRSAAGTVGVRTTDGAINARHVVLAAGAASGRVGRAFGLRLGVEPGYGWSLTVPAAGHRLTGALNLVDEHVVVTPRANSIRLTSGMELGGRVGGPADPEALRRLRAEAERWLPSLRDLGAGQSWRGSRPMTASGLPLVGSSRRDPHLHFATGHGTLGVTLAPVTGELITQLIADVDAGETIR